MVRALAANLGVATDTVARAYRGAEAAGPATTRRRVGTIVRVAPVQAGPALRAQADAFVTPARQAGLSDEAVLDLVRGSLLG